MYPRRLLAEDSVAAAHALLGARLVRSDAGGTRAGRIVEVEAYVGTDDLASHARFGPTQRNGVMFGPPGRAYVYLVYGMYHCLNVVTEPAGFPAALLVRSVEPLEGVEFMRRAREEWLVARARRDGPAVERAIRAEAARRRAAALPLERLASGPGLVCVAFSIGRDENGLDLCDPAGSLHLEPARPGDPPLEPAFGPRVGLGETPEPWREQAVAILGRWQRRRVRSAGPPMSATTSESRRTVHSSRAPQTGTAMDRRSMALLEFPLVRARLAAATGFPPGRRLAEALEPSTDAVIVARGLDETTQTRAFVAEHPGAGIGGSKDIGPPLERAARGGRLDPAQFLDIAGDARGGVSARRGAGRRSPAAPARSGPRDPPPAGPAQRARAQLRSDRRAARHGFAAPRRAAPRSSRGLRPAAHSAGSAGPLERPRRARCRSRSSRCAAAAT